jgi:hypothetical protein
MPNSAVRIVFSPSSDTNTVPFFPLTKQNIVIAFHINGDLPKGGGGSNESRASLIVI